MAWSHCTDLSAEILSGRDADDGRSSHKHTEIVNLRLLRSRSAKFPSSSCKKVYIRELIFGPFVDSRVAHYTKVKSSRDLMLVLGAIFDPSYTWCQLQFAVSSAKFPTRNVHKFIKCFECRRRFIAYLSRKHFPRHMHYMLYISSESCTDRFLCCFFIKHIIVLIQ